MDGKPTYKDLEQRIRILEEESTRGKLAENALRENEEKYRNLFENANEAIFVAQDGKLVFLNPMTVKMSGYPADELMSRPFIDFIAPDDRDLVSGRHAKRMKGEETPYRYSFRIIHKNGDIRWMELSAVLIKWNGAAATLNFMNDITERKQTDEALQLAEFSIEHSGVATIWFDRYSNVVRVNEATCRSLGYTREELLCMKLRDFDPDFQTIEKWEHSWLELKERRRHGTIITRHRRKDGSILPVEVMSSFFDYSGKEYVMSFVHDITERKRADEELHRMNTFLDSIVENIPDMIFIKDAKELRFVLFNRAGEELLGHPRSELLGKNDHDLFPKNQADFFMENDRKVLSRKALVDIPEEPIQTLYKGECTLHTKKVPILNKEGEPEYLLGISEDITDRKRAERARQEEEEKYRLIEENMADVISVMDMNLSTTYVSPSIMRLRGFTIEEVMEQTLDQIMTPESLRIALAAYEQEMRSEADGTADPDRIRTMELEEYHKDGSLICVEVNLSFLRDKDRKPVAILAMTRDITERKRADAEHMRLVTAIEQSAEGIFLTDTHWIIQYANPALEKMLGYEKGEIVGWHTRLLKSGKHDRSYYRNIRETLSSGKVWSGQGINKKKDGTFIHADVTMSPVYDKLGNVINYVCIHRDITREITLEAQLMQSQKLESIGTLAGGIAHDFNNLLMGIQGYASLTLLDLDPSHPHYENIKRIEQQVQSGVNLTKQLLGFARGGRYEVKPTNINGIIQKTSSMFGRTKKEITIVPRYGKILWPVDVDQGQIEQVFMNLFVNAWQAMPGGGAIYLETENVVLDDKQVFSSAITPGKYVKITITDTGTGMDARTRERVFDPFFTTKEMGRGTGLGLATVYGIIKGHKGTIDLDSEPGHGTTFRIYLPASEKEVLQEKTASGTIARGTETILLVDDEEMMVAVTGKMLESLGYRVHTARSGEEAIAVYIGKRNEISLVILDMIMPGMSGSVTFNRLKEIRPDIRVLLSSGYSLDEDAQTIMERGCNGFLQKPFKLEHLSQKVREILG